MTPDTATPTTRQDAREHVADVLDAMLLGAYGRRVRELAQAEVARAWTDRRLDDAPAVLTAVVNGMRTHMHAVHVGELAVQIVNHMLGGQPEPTFAEAMHVRVPRG